MPSRKQERREALQREQLVAARRIAHEYARGAPVPMWMVNAIAKGIQIEHDRADRAMARVFKRLAACQETREDGGVCGPCLFGAVHTWRRYTAPRKKFA